LQLTPASFPACLPADEVRLRRAIADVDRHLEGNRAALDVAVRLAGQVVEECCVSGSTIWGADESGPAGRTGRRLGRLLRAGDDIVLGRRRWAARDVALMLEALTSISTALQQPRPSREYVMAVE
jgi:hypothetical protein